MGNACCVAARDKTIVSGSSNEVMHRNIRHSPTWSFRWDNRGRVAGEEASMNWFSDGASRTGGSDTKYESTYASEEGSPMDNLRRGSWSKSPFSEGPARHMRTPASDQSFSRNISMDVNLEQVKESTESPAPSYPSPPKLSLPSTSSDTASPLSFQSHHYFAGSTPSRWARRSPGHQLLRQVSDSRIPGMKSPSSDSISEERPVVPPWNTAESTRASGVGSSDGWSMNAFSELMAASHRERWSFDSDPFGPNRDKLTRSSSRVSSSPSVDLQTCGVCSKFLTEKSTWSSQKIFAGNELAVIAVLVCGHVYHAECLENMTPEIDKYDPACPVCTLGEKQFLKLSEKALKVEMDLKGKNKKKSRNRVVDSDVSSDSVEFDRLKSSGHERKGPKVASSSSMKSSTSKPFLKRHFSFGSKGSKSSSECHSIKKTFFWAKSSKE